MRGDKRRCLLEGRGIHGGRRTRLVLERADRPGGPRLHFPGWEYGLDAAELWRLPRRAEMATRLAGSGGDLETPEHLLAALLPVSGLAVDIWCDAPEPPFLDGSALPFVVALESLLTPEEAASARWRQYGCGLDREARWPGGWLRVKPAERFSASYRWTRRGPVQEAHLHDEEGFRTLTAHARSFLFHADWRRLGGSRSLLLGAEPHSGLLIAETRREFDEACTELANLRARWEPRDWPRGAYPLVNQPGWRMEGELAHHKLLDLLGDLALIGLELPRLRIEVENGGHAQNHMLVELILESLGRR